MRRGNIRTYTLDELRQVKGIGEKTIQRIVERFDESEYVSKYDPTIHIKPNSLVNGDMLEVMNGIPVKSGSDPVSGVNLDSSGNRIKKIYTHKTKHSILRFPRKTKGGLHPTQKPIELLEYLIKTYTNENELVLDSTMGSGSTCIAAKNLNRKYIGIELDKKYFEIAKERVNKC